MSLPKDIKNELHPRNLHRERYDFPRLIELYPPLEKFVSKNRYGDLSVDFFDYQAVLALNSSLLACYYGINFWQIPQGSLIPPIPSRADYIHYAADLIGVASSDEIHCLDIGVGANCIYPIIGCSQYGWSFVGSDIDSESLKNAQKIVDLNSVLQGRVELRYQHDSSSIFKGVVKEGDKFDLVIANPPFHASQKDALQGTIRKLRNLTGKREQKIDLNFGGNTSELWCKGGELQFIKNMIRQGVEYSNNCGWFTSLVSKEDNIKPLQSALRRMRVVDSKVIEMSQGNKKSRILAWRY